MSRRLSFLTAGLGLGTLAFHVLAVLGHDIGVIVNLFDELTSSTLPQASPDPGGSAAPPGSSP